MSHSSHCFRLRTSEQVNKNLFSSNRWDNQQKHELHFLFVRLTQSRNPTHPSCGCDVHYHRNTYFPCSFGLHNLKTYRKIQKPDPAGSCDPSRPKTKSSAAAVMSTTTDKSPDVMNEADADKLGAKPNVLFFKKYRPCALFKFCGLIVSGSDAYKNSLTPKYLTKYVNINSSIKSLKG